jgi:hypothetical protein
LSDAVEQLGYNVLNEIPLQARRRGTRAAVSGCSNDILNYPASLAIGLKSAGTNSTRVTFAYVIRHPYGYLTKGDRITLSRESEAIIALANAKALPTTCSSCAAEVTSGVRFCRQCGAPVKVGASSVELELLKTTAGTNAGYKGALFGAIFLLIAFLLPLVLLLGSDNPVRFAKLVKAISVISGSLGISGFLMLLAGLWSLRKLLNQPLERETKEQHIPAVHRSLGVPDTSELISSPASQGSITDATTDLLPQEAKRANP